MTRIQYDVFMRTTITIDDDLMQKIKKKAMESNSSVKDTVNRILRMGMEQANSMPETVEYRCPVYTLGSPGYATMDRALKVAEELEDEEIKRKLQMNK